MISKHGLDSRSLPCRVRFASSPTYNSFRQSFPAWRRISLLKACLVASKPVYGAAFLFVTLGVAQGEDIRESAVETQPGVMVQKEGLVSFQARNKSERLVLQVPQPLNLGDSLATSNSSRALLFMFDKSPLRLRELTRLQLQPRPGITNLPRLLLSAGQIYYVNRGRGATAIPFVTPHVEGDLRGTEFLLAVAPEGERTEITMFDGEVELRNSDTPKPVTILSGQQGVAVKGQPIEVLNRIEAKSVVQWWIYYPGILDPDELGLSPAEQAQLAASLAAYRAGALPDALRQYPDYPNPPGPTSEAGRIYYAGLLLSVGAVDRAQVQLSQVNSNAPLARALGTMIRAVQKEFRAEAANSTSIANLTNPPGNIANLSPSHPQTTNAAASELLAISYAHQATNNLAASLAFALAAVQRSTNFGFGWARVAELEFSHGRTRAARVAVEKSLRLTPRNAQAQALKGYLLAAENKLHDAVAAFDEAIRIDPGLGNAWLGRGLCKRRLSWSAAPSRSHASGGERRGEGAAMATQRQGLGFQPDWLSDLQAAAILEPSRSLLRSYLGKAFADASLTDQALKELAVAKHFDTNDPTPWLYSALLNRDENRINESVRDLESSVRLNDNRALYRSRFLLDEDRAVRSSSLARVYQDAGMNEVAVREAARAVSYDFANYSAHLFLSESYNALRDPTRFNLRYETVWFNELLLANLLSPVGGTPLSQHISQQEYSRLFEGNRVGLSTDSSYRSDGQYRELASQFGVIGNTAWSLDLDYQHNNGIRPNNDLDRIEWYSQFKHQINSRDSLYLRIEYQDFESGDNFQHYDPADASRKLRITEEQKPIAIGAWHREWAPGIHTTLLGGRLESDQQVIGSFTVNALRTNSTGDVTSVRPRFFDDLNYQSCFEAYIAELNQVFQIERHTVVGGGRFQFGEFQTSDVLDNILAPDGTIDSALNALYGTPVHSEISEPLERLSLYAYDTWAVWPTLRLTAGLTYDHLRYPENFRFPPLTPSTRTREQLSPKAALVWDLRPGVTLRGMYAQALGGVSFDESFRLEPTQLAGFGQAFRSVISEAEVGSVAAPRYELGGAALDMKLSTHTYLGLQAQWITSTIDQEIGVFYQSPAAMVFPGSTREKLHYDEKSLTASIQQLLGNEWSAAAAYRYTDSTLDWSYPAIPAGTIGDPSRTEEASLHQVSLLLLWNHPNGLFARAESNWYFQDNDGYPNAVNTRPRPAETLNQINLFLGWRFLRRRGEVTFGCLNVTDQDYRLNSLTPYPDLPRERAWLTRLKFNF